MQQPWCPVTSDEHLSGPKFRHQAEGIVEASVALRTHLEKEKAAMQRIWAKRAKQIDRAVANTVGLHGDFSGIIGSSLPQIEKLELPAITADTTDDSAELGATESPA